MKPLYFDRYSIEQGETMSPEIVSAIIGAIAGAVAGGLVSWVLQRQQIRAGRNWDLALRVAQTLGGVLSAYTPDALKTKDDVWRLQQQWGERAREASLLGWDSHGTASPFAQAINDYFQALLAYVDGKMQRGELEHRRAHCRALAQSMMRLRIDE